MVVINGKTYELPATITIKQAADIAKLLYDAGLEAIAPQALVGWALVNGRIGELVGKIYVEAGKGYTGEPVDVEELSGEVISGIMADVESFFGGSFAGLYQSVMQSVLLRSQGPELMKQMVAKV